MTLDGCGLSGSYSYTESVLQEFIMLPLSLYTMKSVIKNWGRIEQGIRTPCEVNQLFTKIKPLMGNKHKTYLFHKWNATRKSSESKNETEDKRYKPVVQAVNRSIQ